MLSNEKDTEVKQEAPDLPAEFVDQDPDGGVFEADGEVEA